MTVLNVQPLVLRDIELILGEDGDDFRKHVSSVRLEPRSTDPETVTWRGLGDNVHQETLAAGDDDWSCVLEYVQDWDSPDSLSRYLYENAGQTVPATFRPRSGVGPSFTSSLTLVHGAIGGNVAAAATSTVTCGSTKPVLVPAAG